MSAGEPLPLTSAVPASDGCGPCTQHRGGDLQRLGVSVARHDVVAVLAGNPNAGKSTLFNTLTGLRQHVGNWAGKTVGRSEGGFRYNNRRYKLVDLPGTYSLLSTSADEEIARDALLFGRPDIVVVVADATRLERDLNLVLQVLEVAPRAVVAVNLVDEARRHGITVDARHLSRELGVPVVPTSARSGEGVPELLAAIDGVVSGAVELRPHRVVHRDAEVERAVAALVEQIGTLHPGLPNRRWVALRLLEGDPSVAAALREGTLGEAVPA